MSAPVALSFMVPGISKCGTTTLCALLNQHPQLYLPQAPRKEPALFVLADYRSLWSTYRDLFDDAIPEALLGEGSTLYSVAEFEELARQRVLLHYPDIRLIFIVRDPIERIESSFRDLHNVEPRLGVNCPFDLHDALLTLPNLLADTRYRQRIANWRDHVAEEQVLVVFLEDLRRAPDQVAARCFAFLGVDPSVAIVDAGLHLNRGAMKLYDTEALRAMRTSRATGLPLSRVRPETQDQFLVKLGLRRRFDGGPLHWPEAARELVVAALRDDVAWLLAHHRKPFDFWPRFAAACAGDRRALDGQRIP